MLSVDAGLLGFQVDADGSGARVCAPGWEGFTLGPLACGLSADGRDLAPTGAQEALADGGIEIKVDFALPALRLTYELRRAEDNVITMRSQLTNRSGADVILNRATMLSLDRRQAGVARFGAEPSRIRIYEQSAYSGRVRPLCKPVGTEPKPVPPGAGAEPGATELQESSSQLVWAAYDTAAGRALLVGYETSARWVGEVRIAADASGAVREWTTGFDGGDLRVLAGETLELEDIVIMIGSDPLAMLDTYGQRVADRNGAQVPAESPVSFCSWYPYRLAVTGERMLANARVAAERLKPLGFSIMEIDLGWEDKQIPAAFEENELFPHGLRYLADEFAKLGLKLGVWKAPYTISEFDAVYKEHPEWLVPGEDGKPEPLGEWFWQPHGQTYALDLTHPGAQDWLRRKVTSLAERGVFYLKTDFIGGVASGSLRRRHNDRIVAGGGWEAARIGSEIMHQALRSGDANAMILCCGGPEMPGRGQFLLLYTNMDTGNTGCVGWKHLGETYTSLAAHLFKHRRWGVLQPSCCVVGLPGTLEEARLRASATFLCGGQVDISDDLTTLPEDRWQVLQATLPPQGRAARPVDLFEPVMITSSDYESMCRGDSSQAQEAEPRQACSVWALDMHSDWDAWTLVGLFDYEGAGGGGGMTTFRLPLQRLGLDPDGAYWAHEFWSGQFLGEVPAIRPPLPTPAAPQGYAHPGDAQALIATREPGMLDVGFFGPAVKLLVLRPKRKHPWIAATSFYQGGGSELRNVRWHAPARELSGELLRPAGHEGRIFVCGAPGPPAEVEVAGRRAAARTGANGSVVVPIVSEGDVTPFRLRWG